MTARAPRQPYSWRHDPAVPRFDDARPLIVFDGVCVFCSTSMRFIATHGRDERLQFTPAQSTLGDALMHHLHLPTGAFETMLLIEDGHVLEKRAGIIAIGRQLRWPWRAGVALWRLLPGGIGDRVYDAMASVRYRLFGRYERCIVPDARWRARVIS